MLSRLGRCLGSPTGLKRPTERCDASISIFSLKSLGHSREQLNYVTQNTKVRHFSPLRIRHDVCLQVYLAFTSTPNHHRGLQCAALSALGYIHTTPFRQRTFSPLPLGMSPGPRICKEKLIIRYFQDLLERRNERKIHGNRCVWRNRKTQQAYDTTCVSPTN